MAQPNRNRDGEPSLRKILILTAAVLAALAFVLVVRRPETQSRLDRKSVV